MEKTKLDCLLVNPPSRTMVYGELSPYTAIEPPVWMGLIARYLIDRGFEVDLLDAEAMDLSPDETAAVIMGREPKLAVFCIYGHQPSASTQCMPGALTTLGYMKAYEEDFGAKHVFTAALGTHPSALPVQTLQDGFDFVIQGEGPFSVEELLRYKLGDDIPVGVWQSKPPISPWRTAPLISDLDRLVPRQAWSMLDMKRYRPHFWHRWTGRDNSYTSVQTSLGCPFSCSFCCINAPFGKRAYRMWSPENVVDQIERAVMKYAITNIKIPDEMFVMNRAHVEKICLGLIERGLGDHLNMWAYARVDTVKDVGLLGLMRQAGFRWLGIGIESASKHVRDGIEKGRFGEKEIEASIRRVHAAGIEIGANYIFGLPDDTLQTMEETLALACHLNTSYANFYCAMAYPGSPLHAQFKKERPEALPEAPEGPGWIGYSQHAYESKPLPTDTLTYQEVLDFRDAAWAHYYTRARYLEQLAIGFGVEAVHTINAIAEKGFPRRKHREVKNGM
jgi:anaerobic magnesium-protoporphyrin IX monomethyl ester cyclase